MIVDGRRRLRVLLGVTLHGAERVWPFYAARVRDRVGVSAFGAAAGRALTPSLVPRGDPRQRTWLSARSRFSCRSSSAPRSAASCSQSDRSSCTSSPSGCRSWLSDVVLALHGGRQPAAERSSQILDEVLGRRSPHSPHERSARGDLARSVRRAARRRRGPAPGLREGHPRGRASRARRAPDGSGRSAPSSLRWRSSRGIRSAVMPGPHAARGGAGSTVRAMVVFGLLSPDVAVHACARPGRRIRPGQRRPPLRRSCRS